MNRRRFLWVSAGGVAGLALWSMRPSALGRGGHDAYFQGLGESLRAAGFARPRMLVDLDRLDQNIDELIRSIGPRALRVVAKSLPSTHLIDYILDRADASRVMVFHQPFINAMATGRPDADLLLGKPMPVAAAATFYDGLPSGGFDPTRQLQWLIDTPERLRQYRELAAARDLPMRLNIELDVGLHRGGLREPRELAGLLEAIDADPRLEFAGLMGYDPHVVKLPGLPGVQAREFSHVQERYQAFLDVEGVRTTPDVLTLNAAGSPTYKLWADVEGIANELSVGSGLMKPLDFDIPTLDGHVPALFIATPVLKTSDGLNVPGLTGLNALWTAWDPNRARTFFTYGGNWMARPVSPPGLTANPVFGHSSNQEMLNGSKDVDLEVDDYVFLRPTQSEFVMLQFGDLVMIRNGEVVDEWKVFGPSGAA